MGCLTGKPCDDAALWPKMQIYYIESKGVQLLKPNSTVRDAFDSKLNSRKRISRAICSF